MILCFGEPLLDLFATPVGATFADAEALLPRPGGAPLNVAVVLGRGGVPARFVGSVGADPLGDRILRGLRDARVDASAVVRSSRKTGMVLIRVALDGAREFLGYAESGAEYDYSPASYLATSPEPLAGCDWLVVGSGSLTHEPMVSALRHVVSRARALHFPIAVDLNVRPGLWSNRAAMLEGVKWLSSQATVLRASAEDLVVLGLDPDLVGLRTLCRDAVPVLSLGSAGAVAGVGGRVLRAPAPPVDVVDSTGAGDAFTAGLLAHLWRAGMHPVRAPATFASPERWQEALECACRFGAHACTALGSTDAFASAPLACEHAAGTP